MQHDYIIQIEDETTAVAGYSMHQSMPMRIGWSDIQDIILKLVYSLPRYNVGMRRTRNKKRNLPD
jgi:hypothetical protein